MPSKELQGSALSITAWDEESSRLPRWHLVFHDRKHSYYASQCNLMLEWSTRSDGKWGSRSAQRKSVSLIIDEREIEWMIETGKQLPSDHSSDCLHHGEVHSHGGHSPTKSNSDSIICWHISSVENGKYQGVCYLRKNSPLWTQTDWGRNIMALVQPYLTEAPWRQKASERNPSVS